ncbi:hypothetical protein AOC05_16560 [Arthrobacter alpinus]|uniref:O-methyltransferase n=1 Tax=Arthrobacter alpinus TaxID=656366 RepID=A0A0M4RQY7_9MICC|nr:MULTISPECIES: hypothetical protein [Arthrobacter]ALE93558.1 hypothetical protein AOC05_16560 [Arthrobacter alpinus]
MGEHQSRPGWTEVAPNAGKLLMLLARIQGARRVLEIGTLAGFSALWLARGLPTLLGGETYDFVFIDADKGNNVNYLKWALKLSRPGSGIVMDNVIWEGTILSPERDPDAAAIRATLEFMGASDSLDATAVQTAGSKGWDGFAIAVVL